MPNAVDPQLLGFILTLAQYFLFAFGIMILGGMVVYAVLFWKGNISGPAVARILHQTDVPKLATIHGKLGHQRPGYRRCVPTTPQLPLVRRPTGRAAGSGATPTDCNRAAA